MIDNYQIFYDFAYELAELAYSLDEVPVGAVIIKDNTYEVVGNTAYAGQTVDLTISPVNSSGVHSGAYIQASIFKIGGAQSIAALSMGTNTIPKVDKIFGPGSDYVARAKREVFGDVGIEGMIAGPSEITVVADNISDTNKVITSLAAQSEHLSLIHI